MDKLEENEAGSKQIIHLDEDQIRSELSELVRGSVEDTLNELLDQEADALCGAKRYERSPDRQDTRTGSYSRKLHTKAGEVDLKFQNFARCLSKLRS